jgi:hypothetical protein
MSDKFETTGKVYFIGATETRGNFTFRKFVLEIADNPKYPQFVEFLTRRRRRSTCVAASGRVRPVR